jgi:hypothetical protein
MFEPFPSIKLLEMIRQFVNGGGRLIWLGPPPILTMEGEPALPVWEEIFGVKFPLPPNSETMGPQFFGGLRHVPYECGLIAAGNLVRFEGALKYVAPQLILTDFLVDHIYPVTPQAGTESVARVRDQVIGTRSGSAVFLGYRPRDDQSGSLGYDERNWFNVLDALGAYPPSGHFEGINDNADHVSRTGDYMAATFPNGAIAIAPHLREIEETWDGGFSRDKEADNKYLVAFPPPSDAISLRDYKMAGHSVAYDGHYAVAFRVDPRGNLIAFSGRRSREITIDGKRFTFADRPIDAIAWAPVKPERRIDPRVRFQIRIEGVGAVRIPVAWLPPNLSLHSEGQTPGSCGAAVDSSLANGMLAFNATSQNSRRWIYGVASDAGGARA